MHISAMFKLDIFRVGSPALEGGVCSQRFILKCDHVPDFGNSGDASFVCNTFQLFCHRFCCVFRAVFCGIYCLLKASFILPVLLSVRKTRHR